MTIYCMKISYLQWIKNFFKKTRNHCIFQVPSRYVFLIFSTHLPLPPFAIITSGQNLETICPIPWKSNWPPQEKASNKTGRQKERGAFEGRQVPLADSSDGASLGSSPLQGRLHFRAVSSEIFEFPNPLASLWEQSLRYWRWQRPQRSLHFHNFQRQPILSQS